jgi:transcriptional regulator with XRE-family HTH domain
MSVDEVAEQAELTATDVATLERGEGDLPSIETLVRLATVLSAPPEDLIAGIEWVPTEGGSGEFRVD